MVNAIRAFFNQTFSNPYIAGILISMLPLIELRGGIVYVYFRLGARGFYDLSRAFMCAYIGSCIVIVPLLYFFVPVLNYFKKTRIFGRAANSIEKRFNKKSKKLDGEFSVAPSLSVDALKAKEKKERLKYLALFSFCALPLPLTGVWSSSALAAIMDLKPKKAFSFIMLGNLICAIIISVLSLTLSVFI